MAETAYFRMKLADTLSLEPEGFTKKVESVFFDSDLG